MTMAVAEALNNAKPKTKTKLLVQPNIGSGVGLCVCAGVWVWGCVCIIGLCVCVCVLGWVCVYVSGCGFASRVFLLLLFSKAISKALNASEDSFVAFSVNMELQGTRHIIYNPKQTTFRSVTSQNTFRRQTVKLPCIKYDSQLPLVKDSSH